MPEVEIGGATFRGGKLLLVLPLLGSLIGALWGGFEFYKDYMDMKEIVQNIDVDAIDARNNVIETKLDEAIDYTRDIKSGLRDDILRIEKQTDRVETKVRDSEDRMRTTLQNAEERFENKRDALQNDYDNGANRLRESNKTDMKDLREKMEQDMDDLEERLNEKLQRALDNPLAD